MTQEEAIKYLKQLYPNGGNCWLDEQRIEAIDMAVKSLQEKQQWINKACNTINYLLEGYIIRNFHSGDSYDMDKLIDDFKKTIKKE